MAQRVLVIKTCDLDHGAEPVDAETTLHFGVDGEEYELDVCSVHGEKIRADFAGLVASARRISGARSPRRRGNTGPVRQPTSIRARREELAAVRAWARSQGMTVNDRGRIPRQVLEQYRAAH